MQMHIYSCEYLWSMMLDVCKRPISGLNLRTRLCPAVLTHIQPVQPTWAALCSACWPTLHLHNHPHAQKPLEAALSHQVLSTLRTAQVQLHPVQPQWAALLQPPRPVHAHDCALWRDPAREHHTRAHHQLGPAARLGCCHLHRHALLLWHRRCNRSASRAACWHC